MRIEFIQKVKGSVSVNDENVLRNLKQVWCAFANRHTKFLLFVRKLILKKLVPGTVIKISVMLPNGDISEGSFTLTDNDITLLGSLEEE